MHDDTVFYYAFLNSDKRVCLTKRLICRVHETEHMQTVPRTAHQAKHPNIWGAKRTLKIGVHTLLEQ